MTGAEQISLQVERFGLAHSISLKKSRVDTVRELNLTLAERRVEQL